MASVVHILKWADLFDRSYPVDMARVELQVEIAGQLSTFKDGLLVPGIKSDGLMNTDLSRNI